MHLRAIPLFAVRREPGFSPPVNPANHNDEFASMNSRPRRHQENEDRRSDHGIQRDSRGEDQPNDEGRAQQSSRQDAEDHSAHEQPPSPGQPAKGE